MAIFHLSAKVVQRSKGHSAVAAAAYRARMEILNERTGETWDYSRKANDVLFAGIYAPKNAPAWMQDRVQLWNAVEKNEARKDAQLARDFIIALPSELTLEQQRFAVQDFVRESFTRKGYIADVAIHRPDAHGDDRNTHAHILVTMRQVDGASFAAKKERTPDKFAELEEWREGWARIANRHLERHGHAPTLDHRSLEAQGIDRTPTIHLGKDAAKMERDGVSTERGDTLRAIQEANRLREEARALEVEAANANARAAAQPANDDAPKIDRATVPNVTEAQSAINRMNKEDRAEQIETLRAVGRSRWATMGDELRGIFSAMRSLTQTMGTALSGIIKGGGFFQAKNEVDHTETVRQKAQGATATGNAGTGGRNSEKPQQKPAESDKKAAEQTADRQRQERERAQQEATRANVKPPAAAKDLDKLLAEKKAEREKQNAEKSTADKLRDGLQRGKPSRGREPEL